MPSEISPAAVAWPAPANVSVDRFGPVTAAGSSSREIRRVAPVVGQIAVAAASLSRGLRRLVSALGGVGEILAVAYAFPLLILAVGIPVALLARLAMWIARSL